jgi:hypothetical protein
LDISYQDDRGTLGPRERFLVRLYAAGAGIGLSAHFGALILTNIALRMGIGSEANGLYYLLGPYTFASIFAAGIVLYYLLMWKISAIPLEIKCVSAFLLTGNTVFDFAHDLSFYFSFVLHP